MLKVKMYKWHTFTAENMARMCGMSYSHFRERFETYYGCSATEWLRRERICRIMEDMTYRTELTLKEVADATISFPRATSTISASRECSKDRVN